MTEFVEQFSFNFFDDISDGILFPIIFWMRWSMQHFLTLFRTKRTLREEDVCCSPFGV